MVVFKRCCAGIQNRNPEQPRDCLPHHACLEQPLPSQQGTHTAPPVRPRLQPRRLSRESQRGPGGSPRPSSEGGARAEEDQSGEWVFAFGHALPDPGLGPRPVLHLHHCQRGENVQVRGLSRTAVQCSLRITVCRACRSSAQTNGHKSPNSSSSSVNSFYLKVNSALERQALIERHLVSRCLVTGVKSVH